MYKIIDDQVIQRESDGAFIPRILTNKDYREFVDWQDKGGQIKPADPKIEQPKITKESLKAELDELRVKIESLEDDK